MFKKKMYYCVEQTYDVVDYGAAVCVEQTLCLANDADDVTPFYDCDGNILDVPPRHKTLVPNLMPVTIPVKEEYCHRCKVDKEPAHHCFRTDTAYCKDCWEPHVDECKTCKEGYEDDLFESLSGAD